MKTRRWIKPVLLVAVGVIVAFPLFSLTYYTMVRTSTPHFCASCHEIRPAYHAWKTSTHVNNEQGIVADCMDCHLPAPHDTVDFFFTKTLHGAKDVAMHFFGGEYDRAENRKSAWCSIDNEQCRKCHRNILHMPGNRGAMMAHRTVLYSDEEYKCLQCHYNLVHVDRGQYAYQERGLGHTAKGLLLFETFCEEGS